MSFLQLFADAKARSTGYAFVWSRLLKTPFWAIYSMLPVILCKELHASPFQVALMTALKPTVSILSIYWSANLRQRPDRLKSNIIWAGIFGVFPFLFSPFIDNVWFFIAAFGLHMMFHRAAIPAWMEILKLHLPDQSRDKVFAWTFAVVHIAGDLVLPLVLGFLLDGYSDAWRWIFVVTTFLSLLSVWFQLKLSPPPLQENPFQETPWVKFQKPWVSALKLLKRRPDFLKFQCVYMLGGGGLMLAAASIPSFFVDELHLSYKEVSLALLFCKGMGVIFTSSIWAEIKGMINIYAMSCVILIAAGLHFLLLLASPWLIGALYLSYLCYGVMQGGSEMNWNLSGPAFAGKEDSTEYTSVNILTVGIRGCFIPFIGAIVGSFYGINTTIALSAFCCFSGAALSSFFGSKYSESLPGMIQTVKSE